MQLNTIAKMEEFITNALLSSEMIPLGVNVITLAATHDEEGIARMARSIVVRYTGSNANIERRVPLVITRTLSFEVSIAAQSYLTESGHDYAVQMCAASHMILTNQVPTNTGAQVTLPFHLTSETFDGLTDSSHYVYSQTWQIEVQELTGLIALDPCVARGNCSYLFPDDGIGEKKPGDVLVGNLIWEPVLPPPQGLEYEEEYCGVVVDGNDLVYLHDKTQTFLEDYHRYTLVPTNTYDNTNTFLIVNIYTDTGSLFGSYFASRCSKRFLIQFGGKTSGYSADGSAQNPNWVEGLWASNKDSIGNMDESGGPEPLNPVIQSRNTMAYVNALRATVFADPSDPNAAKGQVKYGWTMQTLRSATLTVSGEEYIQVSPTPLGKAWMRIADLYFLDDSRDQQIICGDPGEIALPPGNECD